MWMGKYLGFLNVPALIYNCLQLILLKCESTEKKRRKTSVLAQEDKEFRIWAYAV